MHRMALLLVLLTPALRQDDEAKIKAKHAEITDFLKTAKGERDLRAALSDLRQLADRAYEINRYELSARLLEQAEKVARALKDARLAAELRDALQRATAVRREYDKVVRTELKLSLEEGKPEEYLAVGKFLALVKGDWKAAVPFLARGSDAKIKEAAEADLADPKSPEERVAVADRWWALGDKFKERALHGYQEAWKFTTGVTREKVRGRAREACAHPGDLSALPPPWTCSEPDQADIKADGQFSLKGRRSLRLVPSTKGQPFTGLWSPNLPVRPGQKLTVSCSVWTEGNSPEDRLFVVYYGEGGGSPGNFGPLAAPDHPFWRRIEGQGVVPDGASTVRVSFQIRSKTGSVWIDDVALKDENGVELLQNGSFEESR